MVSVGNLRRSSTAWYAKISTAAAVLCLAVVLTSCSVATVGSVAPADIDPLDKIRSVDIMPRQAEPVGGTQTSTGQHSRAAVYEGTEITDVPDVRVQPVASGGGYDLNFENTPVATVAKVVLGDILGTGYTIDPRVQGTVSLVSVRPVAKSDIVFTLENALRLSGVVLVRDSTGYRLTPLGDAVGAGRVDANAASPEPGYGVSVVPLQYVSAQTVLKLMDSFATKPGSVRADSTRNMLLIQGTGAERRNAVETALSFDVDWMRGQSVGIYPLANSAPEPIVAELEKIMDSGDSGLSQSVVKFQPVSRLNAIMVVSRKPALLQTAAAWIKRLDREDSTRNSVHVYQVKYGEAKQIARVLNDMFIGGSGSSSLDSADNQLAPGSGATTMSSADRLSANSNSSSSSQSNGFGSRQSGSSSGGLSGFGQSQPASAGQTGAGAGGGAASAADSRSSSGGNGQPLLQGVRITADTVNNTLLIYADQANYKIIETTLQQVDQPQLQVAIDATIAEVTLTNELSYGVQFYITSKYNSAFNTQSTSAPSTTTSTDSTTGAVSTVTSAVLSSVYPGFNFLIGSQSNPKAVLDALHTVTSVKVLSNPSLVVINNQSATLQVGDVVPVSTGSATVLSSSNTVVNTIDYRNTGIILRVSPRINVNGNVRLDVEQEISSVSSTSTSSSSLTPTVSERRVKSSVSVASGQTVLLAGLISENQNGNRSGIPILDEIPGLGDAFGNQDKKGTRTELIIFIRPQIIRNGTDAHHIAEELRSKLRGSVGASTNDLQMHTVR